jgi:hypothetical protein
VVAEQQPSDENLAGVKTAGKWKDKTTNGEYVYGNQCNSPINKKQVQRDSTQQKNQ